MVKESIIEFSENTASEIKELRALLESDPIGRLLLAGYGIKGNCGASHKKNVCPTINALELKRMLKMPKSDAYNSEFNVALEMLKNKLRKAGFGEEGFTGNYETEEQIKERLTQKKRDYYLKNKEKITKYAKEYAEKKKNGIQPSATEADVGTLADKQGGST
jgi:hypothetical protein